MTQISQANAPRAATNTAMLIAMINLIAPLCQVFPDTSRGCLCHAGAMTELALIIRLDRPSYPFCIEQLVPDGSRLIIERWATEAIAADRLRDIEDEEIIRERRTVRGRPVFSQPEPMQT